MATVTSLTEEKINELMAGWESVGLSQEEINALVIQLRDAQQAADAALQELNQSTLPTLRQDLAENDIKVSELNDQLPDLHTRLEQSEARIDDVLSVDIPSLQESLNNQIVNAIERPKVYVQPDEPTNPDIDERDLVVGDVWYESDNNNFQRIWNGVEWTTFKVDVADFSLTVKKFMTSTHMIY